MARRVLKKLEMDDEYEGNLEVFYSFPPSPYNKAKQNEIHLFY